LLVPAARVSVTLLALATHSADDVELVIDAPLRMISTVPEVAVSTLTEPLVRVPLIWYDPGAVIVTVLPEMVTLLPETVALDPFRVIVAVVAATAVVASGPASRAAASPARIVLLRSYGFMAVSRSVRVIFRVRECGGCGYAHVTHRPQRMVATR
jgi:hypothetical protein